MVVYYVAKDRGVEQLVARRAHNPKVAGSSPAPATTGTYNFCMCLFILQKIHHIGMDCQYFPNMNYCDFSIPIDNYFH